MLELLRNPSSVIATSLAIVFGLAPIHRAHAGEDPPSQPLRMVTDDPTIVAEPPAPALLDEPAPAPAPVRAVDSRRPMIGTGLIVFGALGMAASAVMMIGGMTGPGWIDLDRSDAAIVGGLSVPIGLASMGLVLGDSQANNKYRRWAERNAITPPSAGNGALVGGAAVTMLGLAGLGGGVQIAITDPTPSRSNWAIVGASGAVTAIGLTILFNGMLTRSKFAAWERAGLQPGTMALRGGAGLSLSGRF